MNRRRVLALVAAVLAVAAGVSAAIPDRGRWAKQPSITVISAAGDPRIPLVHEAVEYWNRTLAEVGTPFRLGKVTLVVDSVPDADVVALWPMRLPTMPASLARFPGDILVILSQASFISNATPRAGRVVIAIKSQNEPPLLPNVPRNVIAHELGHAIGLDHHADPALLMCGRPAPCRPSIYQSEVARFFPLSASERARLLTLYPADWTGR